MFEPVAEAEFEEFGLGLPVGLASALAAAVVAGIVLRQKSRPVSPRWGLVALSAQSAAPRRIELNASGRQATRTGEEFE